jgi:hypothetical protein
MYKENSEFALKVQKETDVVIELPERWANTPTPYSFTPRDIKIRFRDPKGGARDIKYATKIFSCYFTLGGERLEVSRLTAASGFEAIDDDAKALLDAYLPRVLQELIQYTQLLGQGFVLVESRIPMIANAFIDLNFKATEKDGNYVGEYKC